jgi:hypothetical protein
VVVDAFHVAPTSAENQLAGDGSYSRLASTLQKVGQIEVTNLLQARSYSFQQDRIKVLGKHLIIKSQHSHIPVRQVLHCYTDFVSDQTVHAHILENTEFALD